MFLRICRKYVYLFYADSQDVVPRPTSLRDWAYVLRSL